jgi:hypothetical protein
MMPERAATLAELRAVREQLHDLAVTLDRQVTDKVAERVDEVAVPREELLQRLRASGKRTIAGLLVLLVLLVAGIGVNRLTLEQAQRQSVRDLRNLVQTCRTTTPTISPADLAYCNSRVPGFERARAQARANVATVARNEQRLAALEAEVAKLEKGKP